MICVVIAADSKDKPFWETIRRVLKKSVPAVHAYEYRLEVAGGEAEFIITDAKSFDRIQADATMIIFKDHKKIDTEALAVRKAVAVVDSCNPALVSRVAATRLPAITCGLSPRDTITLSSIGTDSAVIDLQRSITSFSGDVLEPQEIPVKLSQPVDSFALMSLASIFLLSGKIEALHNITI